MRDARGATISARKETSTFCCHVDAASAAIFVIVNMMKMRNAAPVVGSTRHASDQVSLASGWQEPPLIRWAAGSTGLGHVEITHVALHRAGPALIPAIPSIKPARLVKEG